MSRMGWLGLGAMGLPMVRRLIGATHEVTAYDPGYWELICEELCGQGHYTMQAKVFVLEQDDYNKKFEGGKSRNPPAATQPSNVALAK